MDFRGFHEISWLSGVGGFAASADVCGRDVAPKETFTRFQLAAVSSIFIDFRGFHEIFYRFSWISGDFMRFHGFQGSEVDFIDFMHLHGF